jgi:hypothetical protein
LAVNCASCHQPGGGGGGSFDLRAQVSTEGTGIVRGLLNKPHGDLANRFIMPGDVIDSMAVTRMEGGGGLTRMPPIGNRVVDSAGVALIKQWIENDLLDWQGFAEWQVENFGSSEDPEAAPDFDGDGDGRTNRMEFLAGSDPKSGDVEPLIRIDGMDEENLRIEVPVFSNRSVVIETSDDLFEWHPWDVPNKSPSYPATGGGMKVLEVPREGMMRFFRAEFRER